MADRTENVFDVAILGGGTGGYIAAIRAGQLGLKTALIEEDQVGGVCLHRGCIPTKFLLHTVALYSLMQRCEEFGISAENVAVNYPQILNKKRKVVNQLHKGVEFLLKKNKVATIKGRGTIVSPNSVSVRVDKEAMTLEINASYIIIATGSRPLELPGFKPDGRNILNSDQALEIIDIPDSLVVIGAGQTGVEFASIFAGLGSKVTLIERMPTILPEEDAEATKLLERLLAKRGIRVITGNEVDREDVRINNGKIRLTTLSGDKIEAQRMLLAVGRTGNVEKIGLDKLGIRPENGFIKVDRNQRTGVPGVYAIGDVTGNMLLAHKAAAEGVYVVESLAGLSPHAPDHFQIPRCTYSHPQLVGIGLSEEQAKAKGYNIKVGRFPFRANSMAQIEGSMDGFAKIIADADSEYILGAFIIGPKASELVPELSLATLLQATSSEIALNFHAHPTLAEVIQEAARDVDGCAIHI